MSNWRPRAVIFDFDGVIVNSEPLHLRAFQETFREEGITLSDEEYYKELIGFDDLGCIGHLLRLRGLSSDGVVQRLALDKKKRMERIIAEGRVEALPGAGELIAALARHYPLAICSGALRPEIESMLAAVRLSEYFRLIVAAEDVAVGKPDPSGYLMTARMLSEATKRELKPEDCLIVEDAPTVARNVMAVGFKVLAVATSHPYEALQAATWRVRSLRPQEVRSVLPML